MIDQFYRAFEDKFRGTRSLVKSRLEIYRPFISPLNQIHPDARGLDIGCGRGEWLEVLQEEGIVALGVDLDDGMLQECHALKLNAIKADGIAYLSELPNESQSHVSAFHVVEHISFEKLQLLVVESLRVLKPGGILIMETPNPENITVATCNFYLDPTHQRPIPPQLLAFLPEYSGFHRTKVLRLQQSSALEIEENPSLRDVFEGSSPDYAVVAQKSTTSPALLPFSTAFDKEYGLPIRVLTNRYDIAIDAKVQKTASAAHHAEIVAQEAATTAHQAALQASEAASMRKLLEQQLAITSQHIQQLNHRSNVAEQRLNEMLESTSWRITAPLRAARTLVGKILKRPQQTFSMNRGNIAAHPPLSTDDNAPEIAPDMGKHAEKIFNQLKASIHSESTRE